MNSRRGDSRRRDILWWYHVNKYRAMRGNRSELAPGRKSPRCHVNTPLISVHKNAKKNLANIQGILTSCLVINAFIIPITSIDAKTPLVTCYRHIAELFSQFQVGMTLHCRVTRINMERLQLDLTCRSSDLADKEGKYRYLEHM